MAKILLLWDLIGNADCLLVRPEGCLVCCHNGGLLASRSAAGSRLCYLPGAVKLLELISSQNERSFLASLKKKCLS